PPGGAAGTPSRPDARAVPGSPRPVVAPSPTRLQRQLAAERAEAAPETAPAVQRVRAQRSAPGGGGSRAGAAPAAGAGSPPPRPVAGLEEPRSSSPVASRGDAGAGAQPAASGAVVVQRTAVPGTAGEAPSTGAGSTGSPPVAQAQSRTPGAAGPVQRRVVPGAAGGAPGGGGSGDGSPAPGGGTRGAAGWVQRAPAPDGTAGPPAAGNGSPGSSPVAGAGTAGRAGPVQRAAAPQARDAAPVAGGGSGGGLPVVEARAGGSGGMVQRGPLRVVGDAPATGGESAGSHPLTRARAPGAPGPVQRASVRGAAGEVPPAAGGSVVRHRVVAHPAGTMGPVQRAAVPGAAGEVGSTGHGSAGHPVVEARAPGATRPVQRARLLGPAGDVLVLAGGRGPASRVRGEDAATVQRTSLPGPRGPAPGGADFPLAHAARPVASAGSEEPVQRIAATSAPPQGAPSAELPTVAAPGARPSGGGDTARLAEQVYEILVRRLENERKQRGW
ncbi:MAG TPA: hypothetical protein VHG28_23390, partial [Longimicrobiaceae bacterium]|nr:hypothetical protein [Longimicrobiaceae bacterium]